MNDDDKLSTDENQTNQVQQTTQDELRQRYIEQQRRMSCPGCGEGFQVF